MAPKYQVESWSACAKLMEHYIESDEELKKWMQSDLFAPFIRAFWNKYLRSQGSEYKSISLPDWTLIMAKLQAVAQRGIRVYTISGFELMLDGLEPVHCHAGLSPTSISLTLVTDEAFSSGKSLTSHLTKSGT